MDERDECAKILQLKRGLGAFTAKAIADQMSDDAVNRMLNKSGIEPVASEPEIGQPTEEPTGD